MNVERKQLVFYSFKGNGTNMIQFDRVQQGTNECG